jgi:hypothetical protein
MAISMADSPTATVKHARQQVPSQVVGAQQVRRVRRGQPRLEVHVVDADLVEDRPDQDDEHEQAEDPQAPVREAVAPEAPPGLRPGRDTGSRLAQFTCS